jgi:tetratricopeptide (TPR) repeat protein
MKFLSSFRRHDSLHRLDFHPEKVIGSKETGRKGIFDQEDDPNISPKTLGSDSTYANSFGESRNSMNDAEELPPPNSDTRRWKIFNLSISSHRDTDFELIQNDSDQDVVSLAQIHFHRGCELWAQDDFSHALEELAVSRAMWEQYDPHLLLLMQQQLMLSCSSTSSKHKLVARKKHLRIYTDQRSIHSHNRNINHVEAVAQLYYAFGMVQLALTNHKVALKEFRHALQVALLGLGKDHYLIGASTYMIRMSLLTMGIASPKIHLHIRLFVGEINKERKADKLWKHGETAKALDRYTQLDLLYDMDAQTCARIMTKIATLNEECGQHVIASEIWTDALRLLLENLSLAADHPLAEQVKKKRADIMKLQLERFEI